MRSAVIKLLGCLFCSVALALVACEGTPESICGDGETLDPEECDDGNAASGDGCFECAVEKGWDCSVTGCRTFCGDGIIAGDEVCEVGQEYCFDSCTRFVEGSCGDGIVQTAAGEECDEPTERYAGESSDLGAGGAAPTESASDGCNEICEAKFSVECDATTNSCGQMDVPDDALLKNQIPALCEWLVAAVGGPGSENYCTVNYTQYVYTTNTVDGCVEKTDYDGPCTVGQYEEWALQADACALLTDSPNCE